MLDENYFTNKNKKYNVFEKKNENKNSKFLKYNKKSSKKVKKD
jgi:hypothetical protein